MGGLFGVVSKEDCVMDVYFGTDYHSHLGTSRGGMAVWSVTSFNKSIHNIENTLFRAKFEAELANTKGNMGMSLMHPMTTWPCCFSWIISAVLEGSAGKMWKVIIGLYT